MTSKTKSGRKILMVAAVIVAFSSCSTLNHSMREPDTRVNLNKSDFSLSDQVSAKATSVKVVGIDWARFFTKITTAKTTARLGKLNK